MKRKNKYGIYIKFKESLGQFLFTLHSRIRLPGVTEVASLFVFNLVLNMRGFPMGRKDGQKGVTTFSQPLTILLNYNNIPRTKNFPVTLQVII